MRVSIGDKALVITATDTGQVVAAFYAQGSEVLMEVNGCDVDPVNGETSYPARDLTDIKALKRWLNATYPEV